MDLFANPRDGQKNAKSFRDREEYIRSLSGEDLDLTYLSLCNVMAATNASSAGAFPWITPVLGSGAMSDAYTRFVVEQRVEEAAVAVGTKSGREYADAVREFSHSLIEERLPSTTDSSGARFTREKSDGRAAERGSCLLAVALLTQAYHGLQAQRRIPVSRGRAGSATLTSDMDGLVRAEVTDSFLEPAYDALKRAIALLPVDERPNPPKTGAEKVMIRAKGSLRPGEDGEPSISLSDVHLLTEYCWHLISESLYPGWSDMLWRLFMLGTGWPPDDDDQGPRPITINLTSAEMSVKEEFKTYSVESWKRRSDGGRSGSETHQRVAEILSAQSRVRRDYKGAPPKKPPVPAAFVASFDMELELALFAMAQPFVVALPVTISSDTGASSYAWLGYRVNAGAESTTLDTVLQPDEWFVLSNNLGYLGADLSNDPIVVRLTGSPLVKLPPDLTDRLEEALVGVFPRGKKPDTVVAISAIAHAVLLDEFAALTQSATSMSIEAAPVTGNRRWPGLPEGITASTNIKYSRFWMLLGVQTGDVAIRHTLAAHLAGPRGRASTARKGLAVNTRIAGEAEDLMLWSGLDVVRVSCATFDSDLAHYVDHLEGGKVKPLPKKSMLSCPVLMKAANP